MELTYFGHSAFQIQSEGTTLLFDPFITGNTHAEGIVRADDLHPDVILVSHAHGDHWGDTVSIAKRTSALVIANFEITQYLGREHGYNHVLSLNTGGTWSFDWGRITQTYARHSSSFPDGTYGGNPNGYIVEIEGMCVYYLGDTAPFAEMAWIGEDFDIDVALVPIGDCFLMGPKESMRAIGMIRPKLTVPIHFDTFPVIEIDMHVWLEMMENSGFRTKVLGAGETLQI